MSSLSFERASFCLRVSHCDSLLFLYSFQKDIYLRRESPTRGS